MEKRRERFLKLALAQLGDAFADIFQRPRDAFGHRRRIVELVGGRPSVDEQTGRLELLLQVIGGRGNLLLRA